MIYLDNAATTMHKPQTVIDAVTQAMCSLGNAGRGATSGALDAARTIHGCRAKLARLLGCPRADHVCFTPNSTAALNTAICGVVRPGDRVVTTVLEHNSVLRPLNRLAAEQGVTVEHAGCDANGALDYDELERIAKECRPKVIVGGASAYPRFIDFERMAEIAHEVGAYLMVDMAHIAGLVAAGLHPSPVPHADIVTSTSHKTLRGPRGGFILTNSDELGPKINKAIFPGAQGGPLMHVIAGKAVAFGEALRPDYRVYMEHVVENCRTLGQGMTDGGLRLVSGGTDNHLCLVDLTPADVTGKDAEKLLESVGLTVNKNSIPNEQRSPFVTSGIRVGSAAATTRGFTAEDFYEIGQLIATTVFNATDEAKLADVRRRVDALLEAHPLYPGLEY